MSEILASQNGSPIFNNQETTSGGGIRKLEVLESTTCEYSCSHDLFAYSSRKKDLYNKFRYQGKNGELGLTFDH